MIGEALAFTDAQKRFAYYVVAGIESDWDYGCVNQSDAITLGITQWWAYHAKRLLVKMKDEATDAYALLSQRLKELTESGRSDNEWEYVFAQNEDASSFASAAKLDSCKRVQDELFLLDAFGPGNMSNGDLNYAEALSRWGVDDSNAKTWIMWMEIFHQSPSYCLKGLQSIGGKASISEIYKWCRSFSGTSNYLNRHTRAYNMLNDWDGESEPPDFGMVLDNVPGDPGSSIEQDSLQDQISYVEVAGNELIIHGKVVETDKLICYNTGRGIWLPHSSTNESNPGSGSPADGDAPAASADDPADFPAMRQLWYDNEGKWSYSQGAGRLNPIESGYTDCGGGIYWAANAATNNKYSWIGTWTMAMRDNCHKVYETTDGYIPIDVLRPGDLIVMDYNDDGRTDHVDWYFGNGAVWSSGFGSGGNPRKIGDDVTTLYQNYWTHVARLWVCRFLD